MLLQYYSVKYRIKENALIARIAAWKLHASRAAIVIGNTIYLHNTSRAEFLANRSWLNHELEHIRQYQRHGFFRFLFLYLSESIKTGYNQNRFEVEARAAENKDVS